MTTNEQSVLDTIKKSLGVDVDVTVFDDEIIMHVNSAFGTLNQLGVGPTHGFEIEDNTGLWSDFIGPDDIQFASMKTYVSLSTKLKFDPPPNSWVLTALKEELDRLEWRLNIVREDRVEPAVEDALLVPPSGVYYIDGGGAEDV